MGSLNFSEAIRSYAVPLLAKDVWDQVADLLDDFARCHRELAERAHHCARWARFVSPRESPHAQAVLAYILSRRDAGGPRFEPIERIAMGDPAYDRAMGGGWRISGGIWQPAPEPKPEATPETKPSNDWKRRPRKGLLPIRNIAACPYRIDVSQNMIIRKGTGGKGYRISRGAASVIVNRLVRGMLRALRKKRASWSVKFTPDDARAFHKHDGSDNGAFYDDCIVRAELKGDGNQQFGDTARLRE